MQPERGEATSFYEQDFVLRLEVQVAVRRESAFQHSTGAPLRGSVRHGSPVRLTSPRSSTNSRSGHASDQSHEGFSPETAVDVGGTRSGRLLPGARARLGLHPHPGSAIRGRG